MAIAIMSDLVLDVVKAANPDHVKIAQASLQRGQAIRKPAMEFADVVKNTQYKAGIGRFLSTDIVGDVVNAANPSKLKDGIFRLAGTTDPAKLDMENMVISTNDSGSGVANEPTKAASAKQKSYQQFEATVLRSFVEEMLPKSTESVYGAGTAGNVWRSMQADFMSQELAKSGGIGIASTLARMDQAKLHAQSDATLNQIVPSGDIRSNSIINTKEWPYFRRSEIGVLQS